MTEKTTENQNDLQKIREEIDSIDNNIHDLLIKRASIIQKVVRVKTKASYRPEREAAITRRLFDRHSGGYPFEAIQQIWREIVAATLRSECDFSICTLDKNAALFSLSQKQFGVLTPISLYSSSENLFSFLRNDTHALGILPYKSSFFKNFVENKFYNEFKVVALLPFLQNSDSASDKNNDLKNERALIITKNTPEEDVVLEESNIIIYSKKLPSFVDDNSIIAKWDENFVFTLPFAKWKIFSSNFDYKIIGNYASPIEV